MREETRKWHNFVLNAHRSYMFNTLINNNNLTTKILKQYEFEDDKEVPLETPYKGYFAVKEIDGVEVRYFIESQFVEQLPIRVNNTETWLFKDSSRSKSEILRPLNCTAFRVRPEKTFKSTKELVDNFIPFKHSRPDMWTLNKILAIMGYAGKAFVCICGPSEFGKSSTFRAVHALTEQSIVFRPRTPSGLLLQINEKGNMVFDEVQNTNPETKRIIEEYTQMVSDGADEYINGAIKAKGLKQRYDQEEQSITFLYNLKHYYDKESDFFEHVWANPVALNTKFLKLKVDGELIEDFSRDFNIKKEAEDNKMFYMRIAKHLLYLKKEKLQNLYQRRWDNNNNFFVKGRHKLIYDEITWGIDQYCESQPEYDKFIYLLNSCIMSYKEMIKPREDAVLTIDEEPKKEIKQSTLNVPVPPPVKEKKLPTETRKEILEYLEGKDMVLMGDLEKKFGCDNFEVLLQNMMNLGDLFEPKPGYVKVLK